MEKIKLSCEMDFTLKLIGGKYKLLILYFLLEDEKKRFNLTGKKSPTSIGGAMNCPIVF